MKTFDPALPVPAVSGVPSGASAAPRTAQYSIPSLRDPLSDFIDSWGFEPLGFGFWSQTKRPSILKDNMLSQFMLIMMSQGQCRLQCHGERYLLSRYDCVIVPPYLMYTAVCVSEEPVEYYYLGYEITNSEMKHQYAHLDSIASIQYLPGLLDMAAVTRLNRVYQASLAGSGGRFLQVRSLLYSCLIPMFQARDGGHLLSLPVHQKTAEEQLVQACMDLVDSNVRGILQVADLCRHFHVSQSYLYRSFSHVLHCSPFHWLRTFRIEKSLAFLKSPQYTVTQVAELSGFASVYHYSRTFRQVMGKSPSQYRRELQRE